jgi:hypothetical protein
MGLFNRTKGIATKNEEPISEQKPTNEEQKNEFEFELGEEVELIVSNEQGFVVGRSEYEFGENQYLVCYEDGQGRAVEKWWRESALESLESKSE